MVGIIDYKAGNSHSVQNACEKIGVSCSLISDGAILEQVDHIILPGVGSAGETMDSLKELNMIGFLEKRVLTDKIPFLGICVGMQILFEHSEEDDADCLGWLKGKVIKFDKSLVRIPQMGWNNVTWEKQSILRSSVADNPYFYFVNSYHAVPADKSDILATTAYGCKFTSMVERDNIHASQFHIEKSGGAGLTILKNFTLGGGTTSVN